MSLPSRQNQRWTSLLRTSNPPETKKYVTSSIHLQKLKKIKDGAKNIDPLFILGCTKPEACKIADISPETDHS